jgi:hypothetical protein
MSEGIRYKMEHLGDIYVDALLCTSDSAKKYAKSVVLTYDIWALKKKREQQLGLIGLRRVQLKKAGLTDVMRDDKLVELIADEEKISSYIASFEEKKKMLACGCQK